MCPNDHITWLKDRLMHGNEINLGQRLKGLLSRLKSILEQVKKEVGL